MELSLMWYLTLPNSLCVLEFTLWNSDPPPLFKPLIKYNFFGYEVSWRVVLGSGSREKAKRSFSSAPSEHRQGGWGVDFGSTPNLCVRAIKVRHWSNLNGEVCLERGWVHEALHVLTAILLQIFQRGISVCLGRLVNISRPFFLPSNCAVQYQFSSQGLQRILKCVVNLSLQEREFSGLEQAQRHLSVCPHCQLLT